jgi:hypothetical protein
MIEIPYFSQRDNYTQAHRTCYSSSVAMLLAHKGLVTSDDEYLEQVVNHPGDTTDSWTHIDLCRNLYGQKPVDLYDMSQSQLRDLLDAGIPVAIGILHKGYPSSPTGGHRLVVKGYHTDGLTLYDVNDPYGELMHLEGYYRDVSGESLVYSQNIMSTRWEVNGPGSGWGFYLEP